MDDFIDGLPGRPMDPDPPLAQAIGGYSSSMMTLQIFQVPNGYVVHLSTPNKSKPVELKDRVPALDPEKQIDVLVDGAISFFRSVHKLGEEWDGEGDKDREAIRNAVKVLQHKDKRHLPPMNDFDPGRFEQTVFTDLKELLAYIEKELNG